MHKDIDVLSILRRAALLTILSLSPIPALADTPPDKTEATPNSLGQQIASLPWTHGPAAVHVNGGSVFDVPAGYEMLTPPFGKKFLALVGNLVDESDSMSYIMQPEAQDKSWFMELRYSPSGYVRDTDKIDAKELLESMRQTSIETNKARREAHLSGLTLLGWQLEPHYDQQLHRLEWAYKFRDDDGSLITNLNTRILTRGGFYRVMLVSDVETFLSDRTDFNTALQGLQPTTGNRYSDYKAGDKIAEYGLMGLIGGGAAAVAIKTGLAGAALAFIAKIFGALGAKGLFAAIFGFFAVLWTSVKNLFARKKQD
ncbi:DUF2167 domain-containing protein [Asaia siamensis]|uniref:Membrane-anchored protein n=1 Tax=Asaia siamensis TaxID=110479 RepID=A0ABQ1LGH3_9PROT|nr:DUF2167 domain-containing protein [Asaia siamensis]GBR07833.1 hypothetical protein AA0323_1922 [Asaia siamensis NRIC 0323]GGC24340.1 hypothetical protein GCM10007207_07040 [Asaia siamensis]